MNKAMVAVATLVAMTNPALAHSVTLKREAADSFIAKNFPNAYIPGDVSGAFAYVRHGENRGEPVPIHS